MTEELKTYEEYVIAMNLQISLIMEEIYHFKETQTNSGVYECGKLSKIIMQLGAVSNNLRPYLNNNIPTQYEILDNWIIGLEIDKIQPLFLIAFIRYTFNAKKRLKNWNSLRDKIAIRLEDLGKNSQSILRGLY